jgi:GTP-binding protein
MLAFLIPIDTMEWQEEYDQLRAEISAYSAALAQKPHCVVFSKLDLLGEPYVPEIRTDGAFGVYSISAAARTGLTELLARWWTELADLRRAEPAPDAVL